MTTTAQSNVREHGFSLNSLLSIQSRITSYRCIRSIVTAVFLIVESFTSAQQLEENTVTVQKRTQDIQEIPFGISTFDDEEPREALAGDADVLALAVRSPSHYVESSNGRLTPRFYNRSRSF